MIGQIYALFDPRTGEVRYVGQTRQPIRKRLAQHVGGARSGCQHVSYWIAKLLRQGVRPEIVVLELVSTSQQDLDAREIHWIAYYTESGAKLTNKTPGGFGGGVRNPSAETRAKLSVKSKANWNNPEYRTFHEARVRSMDTHTRQLISAQSSARWNDPEWAAAQRLRLKDDSYRALRSTIAKNLCSQLRKCIDCDRIATPGNMGRHLKHSGHTGFSLLDQVTS